MLRSKLIVAFVLVTCSIPVMHVSARSPEYSYGSRSEYWQQPFEVPGEIVYDLTASELMEGVGEAWQTETLSEALRTVCTRLSTKLYATYVEEVARTFCEPILSSQIERGCNDFWRNVAGVDEPYIVIIPSLRYTCYTSDSFNYGSYGGWSSAQASYYADYFNTTSYVTEANGMYSMVAEAENAGMNMLYPIYDVCSETGEGAMKINNIVLAVADVFGPSTFNSAFRGTIEPYSICGALRVVLGMSPTEYIQNEISILKYPAADALEFLQTFDFCSAGSNREIFIARDILAILSDMSGNGFCDYISQHHTREEYIAKGTTILQNLYSIMTDAQICNDVLTVVVQAIDVHAIDNTDILYSVTGYDLKAASERTAFCARVVDAFTSSSYEPTPYVLPRGQTLDSAWQPFGNRGELLPNLYFEDLVDIMGAAYRAPTIIAGLNVYCTVFESILLEYIPVDVFDLASLCASIRRGDTSALENSCLENTVPSIYGSDYPQSLRPIDPNSIFIYTATKLLQLRDIGETEVCQAIDQLFNSQNISLQYLVNFSLDIALAEIIPSIPGFCQHFEEIMCYLQPFICNPGHDSDGFPSEVTQYPYYYHPEDRAIFEQTVSFVESTILSALGFEDRETLCHLVLVDGIDPVTGRATEDLVVRLRSQIISLLTDFNRCQSLLDTAFETIPEEAYRYRNDNNKNMLYKVTGYETSEAFCEASTQYFGEAETPIDSDTAAAQVNVLVSVALYLRDLIPS